MKIVQRLMIAGLASLHIAGCSSIPAASGPTDKLRVVLVDVEGGSAALYITPAGRSLLIDTGWPSGIGGARPETGKPPPEPLDSAARIVSAARSAGLDRIDYVLISHYHLDHVGGIADLLRAIPVGTVIDHGPNREEPREGSDPASQPNSAASLYRQYLETIANHERRVMEAGDRLTIDGLELYAVSSDRELIDELPGSRNAPVAECAAATDKSAIGGEENTRSLGVFMQWGSARILALSDTTWNLENDLVCPHNRVGQIDLYVAGHHGSDLSNSPIFVNAIAPRVAVVQNGSRKGGDASVLDAIRASPRIEGVWQLHSAERAPDRDEPAERLANVPDSDDGYNLLAEVTRAGMITVTNPRTGHEQTYPVSR